MNFLPCNETFKLNRFTCELKRTFKKTMKKKGLKEEPQKNGEIMQKKEEQE